MTKPTRLFLFVSGGILVAGLGTGLVAAYMGGLQNLSLLGSSGPGDLAYVPEGTRAVAFANIREIMSSELHEKFRDKFNGMQPRNENGLAQFEAETGVNVTRDVDSVLAALGGSSNEQGPPLVLARGRFDTVRIEGFARSKGGQVEDYKGTRVIAYSDGPSNMPVALAFLEPGLVAVGRAEAIRQSIDARAGTVPSVTANEELMRLVRESDEGNVWAVARFDALTSGRLPDSVASRIPPINWLAVTGHVNGGVSAAIRAETRDDAAAKDLRDVIQGALGLARLQSGQNADIAAVVNSVELGGDGKNVSLSFRLPIEAIDRLAGLRAARPDAPAVPVQPAP